MKIALIQTNPREDVAKNISEATHSVEIAASNGAKIVVLPEMFTYMGSESGRRASADRIESGVFLRMKELAKKNKIVLVAGSHAELSEVSSSHVYNTCAVYSELGETLSVYRKIHLFNLRDSSGHPLYCESDIFLAGTQVARWSISFESKLISCQSSICYDIRFPEFFRTAKEAKPADLIFVPSAFTYQTGRDHWEVLLRARAIENQCYVVACNQTGYFADSAKRNFGHSLVVDPWGNVVANAGEEIGILYAEIGLDKIREIREKLPALADRKM